MYRLIKHIWKRLWVFVAYIVVLVGLLWLQKLEPSYINNPDTFLPHALKGFAYRHSLWLGFALAIILAFLPHPRHTVFPDSYARKVRNGILRKIGQEVFEGDLRKMRITLFTESGPLRNAIFHAGMYIKWGFWLRRDWKNRPDQGQFLVIRDRVGGEDRRAKWKTAFYCHLQDEERCEGIAATVLRALEALSVEDLPDIQHIDLRSLDLESDSEEAKRVREYMKLSHIGDIETLKQVRMKARHIYANVVYTSAGRPIGALVVDSMRNASFLNDDVEKALANYTATLSPTYLEESHA